MIVSSQLTIDREKLLLSQDPLGSGLWLLVDKGTLFPEKDYSPEP